MKVVILQPNYAWLGKRIWKMPPYTLAILNACLKEKHETFIIDPNYYNMSEQEVSEALKRINPEVVAISSISTEYIKVSRHFNAVVRQAVPGAKIVLGGILPTVMLEAAMKDKNVDYWIVGEGERSLPRLLEELGKEKPRLSQVEGLAYWQGDIPQIIPPGIFIEDLDGLPFPDYGDLDLLAYGNKKIDYSVQLIPRQFPFAVTITSRGCPYRCCFCAAASVSGRKVRYRSADNVLKEIDMLYEKGIREIMFLDDHFLGDRRRALAIMQGLKDRSYQLTWKCSNLTINSVDQELLEWMKKSGCYQTTFSLESGNQEVLDKIIKKPVKLVQALETLAMTKSFGFEIIVNFVIGFPQETWDQIRETFQFAEKINVDLVNFHVATPLPRTELFETCLKIGCLPADFDFEENPLSGYAQAVITTQEFTPFELHVVRAFEWDRINFSSLKKRENLARMYGLSLEDINRWRAQTRRKCGVKVV